MQKLHFLDSIPEDIPAAFPAPVLAQVEDIVRTGVSDGAISRRYVEGITIDGATSLDLDDAIWAEPTEYGYRLSIHISDVSEAIETYSPIDVEALQRTTSIYRRDYVIPMIPHALSNKLLSLNGNQQNLTLSIDIDIDTEGNILGSNLYESRFQSLRRYNYDDFHHDAHTPESPHYDAITVLDEIAQLLHRRRIARGSQLYADIEDYPLREKVSKNLQASKNPHRIIEATMIAANHEVARFLDQNNIAWVHREHLALDERAFYVPRYAHHRWLALAGYTHFTSPIRRIADLINHRVIKAFLRKEPSPFVPETLTKLISYTNKTVLRIQTLGQEIDHEEKWRKVLERYQKTHWDDLASHHFSSYIRRASHKDDDYRLPSAIRQTVLDDIKNPDSTTWHWAVGIILLGNDITLKDALYHEIVREKRIMPLAFLNILAHTKLFRWENLLFSYDEHTNGNEFRIEMKLPDGTMLHKKANVGKLGRMEHIKWVARHKICEAIFRHYMG